MHGVITDNQLCFTEHVNKTCNKASQKLNAMVGLSSFMNVTNWSFKMKTLWIHNLDTAHLYGYYIIPL